MTRREPRRAVARAARWAYPRHVSARNVLPFLLGLVTAIAFSGCKLKEGESCDVAKDGVCAEGLFCADPAQNGARCHSVAEATKLCASMPLCKLDGSCTFTPKGFGMCVAGTVDDCKQSRDCKRDGACSLRDDSCIVATAADCQQSEACTKKGMCALSADGKGKSQCVAGAGQATP